MSIGGIISPQIYNYFFKLYIDNGKDPKYNPFSIISILLLFSLSILSLFWKKLNEKKEIEKKIK